ncbi:MAG: multiheme c-type cytochrome [Bacteriovoracaceae bacterium]|nr:cytochrome c family protein [Bacteroidota bacterium]
MRQKTLLVVLIPMFSVGLIIFASLFTLEELNASESGDATVVIGTVTDGKNPLAHAVVKIATTTITDTTDEHGRFRLAYNKNANGTLLTAWKEGYYNGGVEIKEKNVELEIVLTLLSDKDNPNYQWVDPAPSFVLKRYALALLNKVSNCGDCHASIIYEQWRNNGHAQSATNPRFMDLYNGTDVDGNAGMHPGFRLDYPHSNGNCSNCHAPAAAVRNMIGVDMNKLEGVEKLGVSCDFCHKVKDVHLRENMSINSGIMHMDLRRPPENHQVFFGPYTDVPHPDAFAPTISKSLYCAPCHQGSFWGVPIYESYSEWLASPYAAKGITCQNCHMHPDSVTTNFAPGRGGLERDPKTIPSHFDFGSRDSAFLASSVKMETIGKTDDDSLRVNVAITNTTAGHHVPTDQPMRNLILLVRATTAQGKELVYSGENTIPYWGGSGDPADGNYEGLPGKGFAKILFERNPQYVSSSKSELQTQISPSPQWRIINIQSDNRIPALATDHSVYNFHIRTEDLPVTLQTELIYRRTFKNWATMKKWNLKDIVLAKNITTIR